MSDSHHKITRRTLLEAAAISGAANMLPREGWAQKPKAPKGRLVLVGGSMGRRDESFVEGDKENDVDPNGIMRHIRAMAGGFEGKTVVVCTCASTVAAQNAAAYAYELGVLGAKKVITITNKEQANSDDVEEAVNSAAMVFFGGGNQSRLMDEVGGSKLHLAAKKRFETDKDFIVGGTSAGAAAMSKTMIFEDRYDLPGMGFTDFNIDTHVNEFHIDNDLEKPLRQTLRLHKASKKSDCAGLALDGSVCVIIADGKASACGRNGRCAQFLVGEGDKAKTSVLKVGQTVALDTILKSLEPALVMP
jgi:cyanophycinase